ncbi:MAG: glycosyltransferase family 1 protein [Zavarzinia sp.]|nr:glycosyltransferase family 1 protein [Zavarzinia sp.]
MSAAPLTLDLTRLIRRLGHSTPTGIDRVEYAYARHFSASPDFALRAMTTDFLGPRLLRPQTLEHLLARAAAAWQAPSAGSATAARAVRDFLAAPAGTPAPKPPAPAARPPVWRRALAAIDGVVLRDQLAGRGRTAATLSAPGPQPPYLHISHSNLDHPGRFSWLDRYRGPAIFFVHDLIPLTHPEYCGRGEDARHARRMETVARHARLIIVNSAFTKRDMEAHLAARGLPAPPLATIPLGIEDAFRHTAAAAPPPAVPYFVVVGTIEPRKNHALLLRLWRRLVAEQGGRAPRLVVIGRRGWANEDVFALLDGASDLSRHVVECGGLDDADLLPLLRGARALLAPSFVEGYGLPCAEALALGVPVVASGIEAHREVCGSHATYLAPVDEAVWADAVMALTANAPAFAERTRGFAAPTWETHMARVEAILRTLPPGT